MDGFGDIMSLFLLIFGLIIADALACALVGPQGLALSALVAGDDMVGGVQNVAGGAVILLQTNDLRSGKYLLEI